MTIVEQMTYAVDSLSGFRAGRVVAGRPITRLDHIVYHLEGHLIRTCSVLDRALQLVNVVFRLGIPERECRFAVVGQNRHVMDTPVADALRNIDNTTQPHRSQRNLVVHRSRYSDDGLVPSSLSPHNFFLAGRRAAYLRK